MKHSDTVGLGLACIAFVAGVQASGYFEVHTTMMTVIYFVGCIMLTQKPTRTQQRRGIAEHCDVDAAIPTDVAAEMQKNGAEFLASIPAEALKTDALRRTAVAALYSVMNATRNRAK